MRIRGPFFVLSLFICLMLLSCSSKSSFKHIKREKPITTSLLSFQNYITKEYLHNKLAIISNDSMRGRRTGTEGQKKAARYLVSQYKKMGIKPAQDNGSYLQKFKLNATRLDSVVFKTYKTSGNHSKLIDKSVNSKHSSGNYIKKFGGSTKVQGPIVFVGFGLKADSIGINQLRGIDLEGKWVLAFTDFPKVIEGDTLFTNQRIFFRKWFQNISRKHAAGLLMISSDSSQEFKKQAKANRHRFGRATNLSLKYLDKKQDNQEGPSFSFDVVSPKLAAKILHTENGVKGLDDLKQKIVANAKKFKPFDTGYRLEQIPHAEHITLQTANVAALLPGSDPKVKGQVVVLSAHYDHLGIGRPDSTGDRINNGADDDGSGTVGVLAMAHAYAKARDEGYIPRRSILFLHFTGEEEGLLGSQYYSGHPIIPIENTVVDLNSDMIARVDAKHQKMNQQYYVYEIGGDLISSGLDSLFRVANSQSGRVTISERFNTLDDPHQFYRRSDHWNFGKFGIPFIFFFTGLNEDYHRPSDEIGKIDFKMFTKNVRTIFATSVLVANTDSVPEVDNQVFINATKN